jgi:hypothetical protein
MSPFHSIEEAMHYVKNAPLTGNSFELPMADGYTCDRKVDRPIGKFTFGMVLIVTHLLRRDFEPAGSEAREGFHVFKFSRMRTSSVSDVPFPLDFRPQRVRLPNATELTTRAPEDIVAFFEQDPAAATDVINESLDKRFMPSTFIEKISNGYRVGWFSNARMECVSVLAKRADAVTDYLLFSTGIGRWNGRFMTLPPQQTKNGGHRR